MRTACSKERVVWYPSLTHSSSPPKKNLFIFFSFFLLPYFYLIIGLFFCFLPFSKAADLTDVDSDDAESDGLYWYDAQVKKVGSGSKKVREGAREEERREARRAVG